VRRALVPLPVAALGLLLLAPAALAGDRFHGGEGLLGHHDDALVTNIGFALIAFFPLFIFLMSVLQWRLEKRKDARMAAARERRARDLRGGW
jgi:hypothetical protein